MRKVVISEFMTLDGVIQDPHHWSFPYWGDDIATFKQEELFGCDGLLLGRVTYEGFAQAWPGRTDEAGYADRINNMPKYVASNTLTDLTWNATLIQGDVAAAVNRLKQEPGQDLLVFGSGNLAQTLMRHGLVDEYRLLVYPIVRRQGQRLFEPGSEIKLKLMRTRPFDSGVVEMTYAPVDGE